MYGENQAPVVVSTVTTVGAVTLLPATGADSVITIAGALAAGLATWGVMYYVKVVRG